MSKFFIMNKEIPVLLFSDELNIDGRYPILDIYNKDMLPYILKHNIGDINTWLKSRVIPTNRNHLDSVRKALDLGEKPTALDYLKLNNGFSLNDSYWIKPLNTSDMYPSDLCFEKYNLYNNKFEDSLGLVTFFGNTSSLGGTVNTPKFSSPELTTQGVMNKAWRRIGEELLLYKRGNIGGANLDKEHFAEAISSEIGRILGINCIPYYTDKWHNQNCSVCSLFTDVDNGYLPFKYYLETKTTNRTEWTFTNIIHWLPKEFLQPFLDMIVFDYIIENKDRHLGNFGFIIDNNTQEIIDFAPLFDHGYSLISNAMKEDFDRDLDDYSELHISFNVKNSALASYVMDRDTLRYKHWYKTLNIYLDNINWFDCPLWYKEGIEKLVYSRKL